MVDNQAIDSISMKLGQHDADIRELKAKNVVYTAQFEKLAAQLDGQDVILNKILTNVDTAAAVALARKEYLDAKTANFRFWIATGLGLLGAIAAIIAAIQAMHYIGKV